MRIHALCLALLAGTLSHTAEPPLIVFVSGEFEYLSKQTLPKYAQDLERDCRVRTVFLERPDDEKVQSIPDVDRIAQADLVVLMVRRMVLPEDQLAPIRKYLDQGKPLVALRTSSHAFENWKDFDRLVLAGNYQGHYGNQFQPVISPLPEAREHPILRGVTGFVSEGSLYKNLPLRPGAKPLLLGTIEGKPPEPVAWTHEHHGGRIFYTSLGHPHDFKVESFRTLLRNGIEWTLNRPLEKR